MNSGFLVLTSQTTISRAILETELNVSTTWRMSQKEIWDIVESRQEKEVYLITIIQAYNENSIFSRYDTKKVNQEGEISVYKVNR
jgi:hypothetical protein